MKKIVLNLLAILSVVVSLAGCSLLFPEDDDNSSSPTDGVSFYEAAGGKIIKAVCRKTVSDVPTNQGSKTLNIWVANDCWVDGGTKKLKITQTMVDVMADAFLKSGSNNDIYDWVTNICGAEWGSHSYSNLISSDQSINILLCDINDDSYATGGVLGYFWDGNNYKSYSESNSNQKVMFVIDAIIYANGGTTWDKTSYYPRTIISTLAHEFQHMINYYQLKVMKGISQDTWLDELLAMGIEDLVAYKLFANYDSSPYYDRFDYLNYYNYYQMCYWDDNNSLPYYGLNYGFGSYLLRQYDGANFVKNIYASSGTSATTSETNTTSGTLDVDVTIDETEAVLVDNNLYKSIKINLKMEAQKSLYFIFTNINSSSSVSSDDYSVSSDNITFVTSVSSSSISRSVLSSVNSEYQFVDAILPSVSELISNSPLQKSVASSTVSSANYVEAVTGKSFFTLQRNWGVAYLLSDKNLSSGVFAYNSDVSSTVGDITYNLVEINAFTQGTPKIYPLGGALQTVNSRANVYYKAADNLPAGTYTITVNLDSNLKLTVVAK